MAKKKKFKFLFVSITLFSLLSFPTLSLADSSSTSNRLAGQDRFQTARAIAEQFNSGIGQDVIITSGNNFPDALSASVLARKLNAPILLVDSNAQGSNEAFNYIAQHSIKSVHIIGGMGIIGADFEHQLLQMGCQIERIGGYDRYETDFLIAQKLAFPKNTPIVIAAGENFPDALSISSVASSKGWPILLVGNNDLAKNIKDYILSQQPSKVYIVGGTGVITEDVESQVLSLVPDASITRFAGKDRFETNALINQVFAQNPKNIYMATGLGFADALAGSALAGKNGDPIILVNPDSYTLSPQVVTYLSSINSDNIVPIIPFGGVAVVPMSQVNHANTTLNTGKTDIILPAAVSLNKSEATINVGANETLTATITPNNAINKNVTWESSNPAIATVDSNGKVVGISAGTAIITVTVDGSKTATCSITVKMVSSPNLELNKQYQAKDGLTVTLNSIDKTEEVGSVKYTISYSLKNETTDQKIDEGTFKMHFADGTYLNQYGFFNSLFPSESVNKSYTFEVLKTQVPIVLEYGSDFFSTKPEDDTLQWKVE